MSSILAIIFKAPIARAVRRLVIGEPLGPEFYLGLKAPTRGAEFWLYQPSASENLLVADSSACFILARFAASTSFN